MELFNLALNKAVGYENCQETDVSVGKSRITIAKELAEELSFRIDEDDMEEICQDVGGS